MLTRPQIMTLRTRLTTALSIQTALFLSLTHLSHSIDSSINLTPSSNSTLIKDRLFLTPYPGWEPGSTPPVIIKSDIPVSLLRYAHSDVITGNNVIDENEMYVYVTSNCPELYDNIQFRKNKDDDEGLVEKLVIRNKGENEADGFLPTSAFNASWNYTSFWCEAGLPGNRKLKKNIRSAPSSSSNSLNVFSDPTSCSVMAEILYDGCKQDLEIHAPLVKINDATLKKITYSETEYECKTHYDAKLKTTELDILEMEEGDDKMTPGRRFGMECDVVVEGRPFVDGSGTSLQAEASVMTEACWSESSKTIATTSSSSTTSLSSDWTQRALGEHASIASFAAFTISLMTNNAPPDLIRDALYAALDEVNHATVSFDTASLLSQQIIEPGALPPSSHDFATDMGGLLRGTFEEGCRDETMSALKAAMEAEEVKVCEEEDCEMRRVLSERLRVIAVDEARHAALAWRTMRWGCSVDEVSCRAIVTRYESLEDMWEEMEGRSSTKLSEEVKRNWERIHEVLMPLVTGAMTMESSGFECGEEVRLGGDFVEEVADRVIREVVCGRGDGSSRSGGEMKMAVDVD